MNKRLFTVTFTAVVTLLCTMYACERFGFLLAYKRDNVCEFV